MQKYKHLTDNRRHSVWKNYLIPNAVEMCLLGTDGLKTTYISDSCWLLLTIHRVHSLLRKNIRQRDIFTGFKDASEQLKSTTFPTGNGWYFTCKHSKNTF